jgi:methionyl-tRNA formyltransferase
MRTALICHHDEPLNRFGLARWLASFTDLSAIIVVCDPRTALWARIHREVRRGGWLGLLDVLAFRLYYRFAFAKRDTAWSNATLRKLAERYAEVPAQTQFLETSSPNSPETFELLQRIRPDLIVARCKHILRKQIFQLASRGTFVMHPGICPEYRNAHGCFWALVRGDTENVGMTLLRIDCGVDTGPVYGYYRCGYDQVRESHTVIQNRVVFDNLDALKDKLQEISAGTARIIDTTGRISRAWGQPRLTSYLHWRRMASGAAG